MIVVHHLEKSRSQRVLWLLEELGVPYELKKYQRDSKTMFAPPELRAVHPLGKAPVVTDDGATIAESGAILEYLVQKYGNGKLKPAVGTPEWLRCTYFMHYAEGSVMPPLLLKLVFLRMRSAPAPFFVKPVLKNVANKILDSFVDPQIKSHITFLENELAKSTWLAGEELTMADIQMSYPVEALMTRGGAHTPKLTAYLDRIHARPAYRRAIEKGGPVML